MTEANWIDHFISFLEELERSKSRGALAVLRRGLGKPPGTTPEMYRYIVPWTSGLSRWREDACYVVAALFAWHPQPGGSGNLGNSFASLARQVQQDQGAKKIPEALEGRFTALLNSRQEDLPGYLRQAVSLLKSKEVPLDWRQLLKDYLAWGREDRRVQRDWARAFWRQSAVTENIEEGGVQK
ncbi:MAG: CRISPR-associated protein Cse2 [Firmicutes bacterium]|nr:CRISPR-associated protein Cse2 [Bacillota bacterium]